VPGDNDPDRSFARVLIDGTDEAITSWIADGSDAVGRLRQELSGERRAAIPDGISDRARLDNLIWASHEVASAFPDEFLSTFHDARWDEDPFVCFGLGAIRRPEVTERLMRILRDQGHWLRIDAAVALSGHDHPELRAALMRAREDPDYIVRYHVEERLAELQNQPRVQDPDQ
jgi:hypothetical protein